jgi:hypothetical protein
MKDKERRTSLFKRGLLISKRYPHLIIFYSSILRWKLSGNGLNDFPFTILTRSSLSVLR